MLTICPRTRLVTQGARFTLTIQIMRTISSHYLQSVSSAAHEGLDPVIQVLTRYLGPRTRTAGATQRYEPPRCRLCQRICMQLFWCLDLTERFWNLFQIWSRPTFGIEEIQFRISSKGFFYPIIMYVFFIAYVVRSPHVEFVNGIDRSAYSIALNKDISVNASAVCFFV